MKLTVKSTEERHLEEKVFIMTGETLYDCIEDFCINQKSNLAGFVELKAEELSERRSPMLSNEDLLEEAFEETMRIYNIEWKTE